MPERAEYRSPGPLLMWTGFRDGGIGIAWSFDPWKFFVIHLGPISLRITLPTRLVKPTLHKTHWFRWGEDIHSFAFRAWYSGFLDGGFTLLWSFGFLRSISLNLGPAGAEIYFPSPQKRKEKWV